MSANDMLELVPESTKSVSEALARLCPLLLLQLHSSACNEADANSSPSLKPSAAAGNMNFQFNLYIIGIRVVKYRAFSGTL